jgi:hypothetical protein
MSSFSGLPYSIKTNRLNNYQQKRYYPIAASELSIFHRIVQQVVHAIISQYDSRTDHSKLILSFDSLKLTPIRSIQIR